jgi:cyclohexadienyl dehydratase
VAQAYAVERGVDLHWVRFRWPELASDLRAARFDLALSGITIRPERSIEGRFSLPLVTSGAVVLVAAGSPIETESDLDRPTVALGVNAGGHLERVARGLFPHAQIEAVPDNSAVMQRLAAGSVDGVVTDSIEAPIWQGRLPLRVRVIGPLTRDSKAAWFSPRQEAEALAFDRWLMKAERTGQLGRLRRRYGLPADPTARALPALLASLNERLSLMPSVAEAKRILDKPIEDTPREERVLRAATRDVEVAAATAGLASPDPSAVQKLFRAQIEAAKWIQAQAIRQAPSPGSDIDAAAREQARSELEDEIRPALLYLGHRIAMLVVTSASEASPPLSYEQVTLALEDQGLPEAHLRALYEALLEVTTRAGRDAPARPPEPATGDRAPSA